jgi:hypothetical protein
MFPQFFQFLLLINMFLRFKYELIPISHRSLKRQHDKRGRSPRGTFRCYSWWTPRLSRDCSVSTVNRIAAGLYENRGLITDSGGDISLLQSVQEVLGHLGGKTLGHEADHPPLFGAHVEMRAVIQTAGLVKHRDKFIFTSIFTQAQNRSGNSHGFLADRYRRGSFPTSEVATVHTTSCSLFLCLHAKASWTAYDTGL